MCNSKTEKEIRKWIRAVVRNRHEDYFDGVVDMDFAKITQLGEDCSAHFNFEEDSEEDEACFEYALIALENICNA